METLHFQVDNNLPVKKQVNQIRLNFSQTLFKIVPQLYKNQINKLDPEIRKKYPFPRIGYKFADGLQLQHLEQFNDELNKLPRIPDQKLLEMQNYVQQQYGDVWATYQQRIHQQMKIGNHSSFQNYMAIVEHKKQCLTVLENKKDFQIKFLSQIAQLKKIEEDIQALKQKLKQKSEEQWPTPKQIQDPFVLKMIDDAYHNYLSKPQIRFQQVSILRIIIVYFSQTMILPVIPKQGPTFYQRLRAAHGDQVDRIIQQCKGGIYMSKTDLILNLERAQLQDLANQGLPIQKKDLYTKDQSLLDQVNLLANVVETPKHPKPIQNTDWQERELTDEYLRRLLPSQGKLLIDDYYKLLKINNQDPEKFNIQFWSEFTKISEQTLRNIFNYTAFPLPDENDPTKMKGILMFVEPSQAEEMKLLSGMTPQQLEDYILQKRAQILENQQLEDKKRIQSLQQTQKFIESSKRQGLANEKGTQLVELLKSQNTELTQQEQAKLLIKLEEEKQQSQMERVQQIIQDDSLLDKIDKEIKEIKK